MTDPVGSTCVHHYPHTKSHRAALTELKIFAFFVISQSEQIYKWGIQYTHSVTTDPIGSACVHHYTHTKFRHCTSMSLQRENNFEPNFIEKFFWESGFSNFGRVTVFAKWKSVYWLPFWSGEILLLLFSFVFVFVFCFSLIYGCFRCIQIVQVSFQISFSSSRGRPILTSSCKIRWKCNISLQSSKIRKFSGLRFACFVITNMQLMYLNMRIRWQTQWVVLVSTTTHIPRVTVQPLQNLRYLPFLLLANQNRYTNEVFNTHIRWRQTPLVVLVFTTTHIPSFVTVQVCLYRERTTLSQISLKNSFGNVVFQILVTWPFSQNGNQDIGRHFETVTWMFFVVLFCFVCLFCFVLFVCLFCFFVFRWFMVALGVYKWCKFRSKYPLGKQF